MTELEVQIYDVYVYVYKESYGGGIKKNTLHSFLPNFYPLKVLYE